MASSWKGKRLKSIMEAYLWHELHIMSDDQEKCCSPHSSNKFVLHNPCMWMYFSLMWHLSLQMAPTPSPNHHMTAHSRRNTALFSRGNTHHVCNKKSKGMKIVLLPFALRHFIYCLFDRDKYLFILRECHNNCPMQCICAFIATANIQWPSLERPFKITGMKH